MKIWKRLTALALCLSLAAGMGACAAAEEEGDYGLGDEYIEESVILNDDGTETDDVIMDEDGDGVPDFVITDEQAEDVEEDLANLSIDNTIDPDSLDLNPNLPDNVINILLIGVDMREKDINSKSSLLHNDVNIILSINTENGEVKLTSLLRDIWLTIPGYTDKAKLNAAYARGSGHNKAEGDNKGAALAMRTVNRNFDMNITQYVVINFYGMASIIDYLGGVDIDLTRAEAVAINNYIKQHRIIYDTDAKADRVPLERKAGVQHLDGLQAVMYARMRKIDNDFSRTARQRNLLELLLKKVLADIDINRMTDLITVAYPYVKTNITASTVFSIASGVLQSGMLGRAAAGEKLLDELRIPLDHGYSYGTTEGGSSYIAMGTKNWRNSIQAIHYFIYGEYYPAD